MPEKKDANSLWVSLSSYGEGNLFAVYPQLLAQMVRAEEGGGADPTEVERLVLPSDHEWRLQQYFMLVEMQKDGEADGDEEEAGAIKPPEEPSEEWAPWKYVQVEGRSNNARPPVAVTTPGPAWDIGQVLKAARLLIKPPQTVEFVDEQDMRSVYSLIYDVFRFKSILDQTIDDIEFFQDYPQFFNDRNIVWLFLMEVARRRWSARPRGEADLAAQLLAEAGAPFQEIEGTIWKQRVHFAAAIARIRIKNRAFSISELLPPHLREERISACVNKEAVTGWVNTFKATKVAVLVQNLHQLGYSYSSSKQLCAGEYRFDRVCPRFITLRPPTDTSIGQMDLVKNGIIVLQEREFCEGASTFCRALRVNSLHGVVAQTHASSPRCSAYLAAQLRELAAVSRTKTPALPAKPELGRLVVFGAGDKVASYVCALRELGIEASEAEATHSGASVRVVSDAVHCETPAVLNALEGVVAVLATPPNSYSAVTDPIDLVCGRGGDLAMLEVLTETEVDNEGKARVQSILEEQKKTLKVLLSKPQIQLILYETHSALEAENQAQVTRAVSEANRLARERHSLVKKKHHKIRPETAHSSSTDSSHATDVTPREKTEELGHLKGDVIVEDAPSRPATASTNPRTRPPSGPDVLVKSTDANPGSRPGATKARPIPENLPKNPDQDFCDIIVPNCDLFEVRKLPTLGNGLDINYILDRDGCYLSLIQRKELTRLDAKYMIRVAEERGLFGGGAVAGAGAGPARRGMEAAVRRRHRKTSFEVERISAPTYASICRSTRRGSAPGILADAEPAAPQNVCSRHARRQAAAFALTHAACTCDQRHKVRRRSLECSCPPASPGATPCRRPFPVAIHDLRLRPITPPRTLTSLHYTH